MGGESGAVRGAHGGLEACGKPPTLRRINIKPKMKNVEFHPFFKGHHFFSVVSARIAGKLNK